MDEELTAVERYAAHAETLMAMRHPRESPYTFIEVSTGAAGMVQEAWDRDAHRLARLCMEIIALARIHANPASNTGAHKLANEILRLAGER